MTPTEPHPAREMKMQIIYTAGDKTFFAAWKAAKAQGLVAKKVIEANGVFAGRYTFVPAIR